MVLIQGNNGQGKSNLLEAIYILAIAKSPRAATERELVHREAFTEEAHSQVSATVRRDSEDLRLQIDYWSSPTAGEDSGDSVRGTVPEGTRVQRRIRVNGLPRRSSDLVGQLTAVMFSAGDLELVYGPPVVRRRYMDILISQLDRDYLRALQRYQRIVYQRNHLLRRVRDGGSRAEELGFWDDELVREGAYVIAQRSRTVRALSDLASPVHGQLTGGIENLELVYLPSVSIDADGSDDALAGAFRHSIEVRREREIAQGATTSGPHRDDLQLLIDALDAGMYASRGQSRTAVLAMKLAEAAYLRQERGNEPIVLLDDVLSELDGARRAHVLDRAGTYEQCFITTTDADFIEDRFLSRMTRLTIEDASVRPMTMAGSPGLAPSASGSP